MQNYNEMVTRELEIYKNNKNISGDLPDIFHYWSNKFLKDMYSVIDSKIYDTLSFYSYYIKKLSYKETIYIASFGCGNCNIEIDIANSLLKDGLSNFEFHCIDINKDMLERGKECCKEQNLLDKFKFIDSDIKNWSSLINYDIFITEAALHHFVDLEILFSQINKYLNDDGYFLINDSIGKNGHARWNETLTIVNMIWNTLSDAKKFNHQFNKICNPYLNWDCTCPNTPHYNFEGIRAQDILPLLIKNFNFETAVWWGGLIEVFIDRGYGHNYIRTNLLDTSFIDNIHHLNELCIELNLIKPTQIIAAVKKKNVNIPITKFYKGWTPEKCVRITDGADTTGTG